MMDYHNDDKRTFLVECSRWLSSRKLYGLDGDIYSIVKNRIYLGLYCQTIANTNLVHWTYPLVARTLKYLRLLSYNGIASRTFLSGAVPRLLTQYWAICFVVAIISLISMVGQ